MKPRILLYDLETSPNLGYMWEKYEQNALAFTKEKEILCFAYKWMGDKEVKVVSKEGKKDDKSVVKALHKLFEEADIIIAHNNDKFDQGVAKARMIFHNMLPPRILQSIDTRKVAKNYFRFNGNGLDDLGKFLKLGTKLKHSGFDMWLGCMADKKSSWKQMTTYNKQDVFLLEKVYLRLKPWIHNHPNVSKIMDPHSKLIGICPTCDSCNTQKRGLRATHSSIKQQWVCNDCNSWHLTKVVK